MRIALAVGMAQSAERAASSDRFGQMCYRAAKAQYDMASIVEAMLDSSPFLYLDDRERIGLLMHRVWIQKQIEAIEKVIEEDTEGVPRWVRAALTSLEEVLASLDSGEVETLAELHDRLEHYPGFKLVCCV